jgi:phasin
MASGPKKTTPVAKPAPRPAAPVRAAATAPDAVVSAAVPAHVPAAVEPIEAAAALVSNTIESALREPAKLVEAMAEPMRDIQAQMRDAAEKGVDETRQAFERLRVVAEDATSAFETSMKTAADGVQAFNLKVVEAMRATAEANFDFLTALVSVRSLSEAIELNTEHARKSFDALSAQSKDLGETARKLAADVASPLRETLDKTLNATLAKAA